MLEIASLKRQHNTPPQILIPQKVEAVSNKILAKRLATPSPYARAYLKATLSEIRMTDENLRLSGSKHIYGWVDCKQWHHSCGNSGAHLHT